MAICVDKRAKQRERGIFGINRYAIAMVLGWSRGLGVLYFENRSGRAREVGDRPSVIRLNFVAISEDKRVK